MRAENTEAIEKELRRIGADLNLSDAQKTQLKTALEGARVKIDEYKANNPNATKADVSVKLKEARGSTRERVTKFLTPEQLTKWDAEVTKSREFLGERVD